MGLLQRAESDPKFFVRIIREKQCPEGTVIRVRSLEKVCVAVVRAWGLLNANPEKFDNRLDAILSHIRGKQALQNIVGCAEGRQKQHQISSDEDDTQNHNVRTRDPPEWAYFKAGVKEAQVHCLSPMKFLLAVDSLLPKRCCTLSHNLSQAMPLHLVVTRMKRNGRQQVPTALLETSRGTGVDPLPANRDWHTHSEWFVAHTVEYIPKATEPTGKALVVKSYKDWGCSTKHQATSPTDNPLQALASELADEQSEEMNNDISNDRFVGGSECVREEGQQRLTRDQRRLKKTAGPFHPVVVEVVRRAIAEAALFETC